MVIIHNSMPADSIGVVGGIYHGISPTNNRGIVVGGGKHHNRIPHNNAKGV